MSIAEGDQFASQDDRLRFAEAFPRNIRADERLLAVFDGKKVVSMFEMTKLVNGHLISLR